MPSTLFSHWQFPAGLVFLNHGSFGATPRRVSELQKELLARMERNPMQFYLRDLEALSDRAREALAPHVGADPDDLAWVANASSGVSTVLRSLPLAQQDEIVVTNHGYNACNQAAYYVAERTGARVVIAQVPFPIASPEQVIEAVSAALSPKTRLVMIDHVTSPTALVFPVQAIVSLCEQRGIETLVDGAHAPGQVPVDLQALGASYYIANCHKWLCAPKSVGFMHVRRDKQALLRPLTISHGANSPRKDRSRFRLEFDWPGTLDPTPTLCVEESISVLQTLAGSLEAMRAKNRALVLEMRDVVCAKLGVAAACPEEMTASMLTLPLPESSPGEIASIVQLSPLQQRLAAHFGIELPVFHFPTAPKRWLRLSAHLYNDVSDARSAADALVTLL